ncbi:Pyridine nucleotide-disulphide oxidoreductase [Singulisphaera sp. GP187]|uniref:FAD-dependent oxidoreductase n=1 Tax=Singulisphaera sp. GP187 TaxID=1882752 RepID=UPI00092BDEA3|nr:FAD-dependent oxidoreductase [Singulisphaera sp. GP187]SIO59001.1 Pyridine nucleotide-disulphide oxidoreductase [Singulisphaera sp. GP187]
MKHRAAGRSKVVIVGGGFAGLRVAKSLRSSAVRVTLLDRLDDHHPWVRRAVPPARF